MGCLVNKIREFRILRAMVVLSVLVTFGTFLFNIYKKRLYR